MRRFDASRLLLVSAFALAATRAAAVENAAPPGNGVPGSGSCLIVDYTPKHDAGYTWYYCPSSRVFIRPGQRWVTNLDNGVETRVLEQERKVRTLPLSVKQEQQRTATGQDSAPSFTATGKTDVVAGVTAEEYIVKVNFGGQPREVHQWFAKDLRAPGQDKAMAWAIDKDTTRKVPPGVFLRDDDRDATSIRKGEPPAAVLAIPADYEKQHWSKEKNGWVDGEK
jgi:hypothetical protein